MSLIIQQIYSRDCNSSNRVELNGKYTELSFNDCLSEALENYNISSTTQSSTATETVVTVILTRKLKDIKSIVFYGPGGEGKTTFVQKYNPKFICENVYEITHESNTVRISVVNSINDICKYNPSLIVVFLCSKHEPTPNDFYECKSIHVISKSDQIPVVDRDPYYTYISPLTGEGCDNLLDRIFN